MRTYRVRLTRAAREGLDPLFDDALERELDSPGGCLDVAEEAPDTIQEGLKLLERFPFTCREAGSDPFLRELVISFGRAGYVALFEIGAGRRVTVVAVRHQREDDFH